MGWVSHLDYFWEEPGFARFLRRLAAFSRLILFDKRGTGLSDRVALADLPTLEQRMDDVRAVLDAVGSARAALVGVSEGAALCTLFAATYPERTVGARDHRRVRPAPLGARLPVGRPPRGAAALPGARRPRLADRRGPGGAGAEPSPATRASASGGRPTCA